MSATGTFRIPPGLQDDPEVKRKLALLSMAIRENPLLRYNNPELLPPSKIHRKQIEFNAVKPPSMGIKALIAGNRSGKTVACVVDDLIQLVDAEALPAHLRAYKKFEPPVAIWIGAPKFSKHEDTILPLIRKFIPQGQLLEGSFGKSYKGNTKVLTLANGSTVSFKTYDQDRDAWASAEVHRIHWDEEPNGTQGSELRAEARGRLVSTGGDEIIGMTPLLGYSWVYEEVYERRHEPRITVIGMDIEDNPWNSKEAIREFLAGLSDEERRARKSGEFVHFGGLFFEEFGDRHIVPAPTLEQIKDFETVVGIDPGLRHTGVTWTGFDNDNAALTYCEHNPAEVVVPEVAREIKRFNAEWGVNDPVYVIDPSARIRSGVNLDQVEAAYAREGIYCQPGQNDRRSGILEMKRRLQSRDAAGHECPTLLISRECPQLIKQIERYRRDPNAADEWAAIAQSDTTRADLVDSLRYAVMTRAWEVPEPPTAHPPSYEHDFQVPFSEERDYFQIDPAPYGDSS